uniref:Uncharacterized protein n=1 Tax=Biomphalaria glabrata TaxID=6526 RepID=A0A2C9LJB9_BIOGL
DRSTTLKVLFEIINSHIEADKQIIIASDKMVKELSGFESRFITRFNSGAIKRVSFFTEDESNIQYTTKVISNIFRELEIAPEEMTAQRILQTVANYYKIKPTDMLGTSRKGEFIVARHMAM